MAESAVKYGQEFWIVRLSVVFLLHPWHFWHVSFIFEYFASTDQTSILHLFPATLDNLLYEDAVDTNDDSAVLSKRFVPLAYIKELNP